jgi:hypothetical protein
LPSQGVVEDRFIDMADMAGAWWEVLALAGQGLSPWR